MWNIFIAVVFVLICYETDKYRKEIYRLTNENYNLKKENEKLKVGRTAYSIGDKIVYFTPDEDKRYAKWHDYYYFDHCKEVNLSDEEELDIVISGIITNKSNQQILKELIDKTKCNQQALEKRTEETE